MRGDRLPLAGLVVGGRAEPARRPFARHDARRAEALLGLAQRGVAARLVARGEQDLPVEQLQRRAPRAARAGSASSHALTVRHDVRISAGPASAIAAAACSWRPAASSSRTASVGRPAACSAAAARARSAASSSAVRSSRSRASRNSCSSGW